MPSRSTPGRFDVQDQDNLARFAFAFGSCVRFVQAPDGTPRAILALDQLTLSIGWQDRAVLAWGADGLELARADDVSALISALLCRCLPCADCPGEGCPGGRAGPGGAPRP